MEDKIEDIFVARPGTNWFTSQAQQRYYLANYSTTCLLPIFVQAVDPAFFCCSHWLSVLFVILENLLLPWVLFAALLRSVFTPQELGFFAHEHL
jgi:hypothetical protein